MSIHSQRSFAFDQLVRRVFADGPECTAITNVQNVDILVYDKYHYGTRTCLVMWLVWGRAHELEKVFFCLVGTFTDCLGDIGGKFWL